MPQQFILFLIFQKFVLEVVWMYHCNCANFAMERNLRNNFMMSGGWERLAIQ